MSVAIVAALAVPAHAQRAPRMRQLPGPKPWIAFDRSIAERDTAVFSLTIDTLGGIVFTENFCTVKPTGKAQLDAGELAAFKKVVADAKLATLKPRYLPRGESDDVGSAADTMIVMTNGKKLTRTWDTLHGPERLGDVSQAVTDIVNAKHLVAIGVGDNCWCERHSDEDACKPLPTHQTP